MFISLMNLFETKNKLTIPNFVPKMNAAAIVLPELIIAGNISVGSPCNICRRCKRCVVRMDHHCVWLNKCVGLGNHKDFILFLVYFIAAAIYFDILSLFLFLNIGVDQTSALGNIHIILFLSSFPMIYGLGSLLLSQLRNMWRNITELERIFTPPHLLEKYRKQNVKDNIRILMGRSPSKWFLPIH